MGQGFESLQARQKAAEKSAAANMVVVAQLVRVPGCGPGGRGFDSHQPPHLKTLRKAKSALRILISKTILGRRQAVRQQTLTLSFAGSNPAVPARKKALLRKCFFVDFIILQYYNIFG